MSVFDAADFHDHEEVAFFSDKASGLKAIVAVHSTVLGPACGGTRMYPYATAQDAVTDVLRLSRGMSYKNAIADLPLGGGKAVIIGDPLRDKSEAKFAAFAEAINALGGRYITAVDSGTDGGDMAVLARYTPHVVGHTASASLETDPSPWTARGVFLGMRAAARARLGASTLRGLRVAVQGVGHVGRVLAQLAHADGAKLVLADFDAGKAELLARDLAAETVPADRILHVDADILSPCALGGVLTSANCAAIRAPMIIGAANNQLATEDVAGMLHARDILYVPDYVVNAGGIIHVHALRANLDIGWLSHQIDALADRIYSIIAESKRQGTSTVQAASACAEKILATRSKSLLSAA